MELVQYIRLVRRWWWLLLFAGFIGGSISFMTRITQLQQYRAETLIAIGGFIQSPNPDQQEIRTGFDLTETYVHIVRTPDVLQATLDSLALDLEPNQLNVMLETRILPNSSLLQLSITYIDPILSADLVNALAQQLILASPTNLTPEQQSQIDLLSEQITSLTQEITELRGRVSTLDLQLNADNLTDARREELEAERLSLIEQINQTSSNIAQFTITVTNLQERTNSVEIIQSALIPQEPLGRNIISTTILGVLTAGIFAFSLVLLYEYLNDTFHNAGEISEALKLPILGVISRYGKKDNTYKEKLLTSNVESRTPDEFRNLRTNLLFSSENSKGLYLLSSALPSEGKSITTANLAISMALSGLRVLLIDGDLRRPRVHQIFELENSIGLSSLLSLVPTKGNTSAPSDDYPEETGPIQAEADRIRGGTSQVYSPDTWLQVLQSTSINNLQVITSGHIVENPTELLGSALMKRWMQIISRSPKFDVILIDTPPTLGFPDAAVVSASLNAKVLLVVEAGRTRREATVQMVQRFEQVKADIVGIILNQANPREESYYGYDYYYGYYRGDAQEAVNSATQPTNR